jgi:hypothetical protein
MVGVVAAVADFDFDFGSEILYVALLNIHFSTKDEDPLVKQY